MDMLLVFLCPLSGEYHLDSSDLNKGFVSCNDFLYPIIVHYC